MSALNFTQDGKRWLSDTISPTKSNIEVCVRFKNPGGGLVGLLRSMDDVDFTPHEGGTVGNTGKDTRMIIFTVCGIVPGGYLKFVSTTETDSGCEWREG